MWKCLTSEGSMCRLARQVLRKAQQHCRITWAACHQSRSLGSSSSNCAGLFGHPQLQQPSDFKILTDGCQHSCQQLVDRILAAPTDATVVHMMDQMSDQLCQVYDAAEAARNIHDDPLWRAAASATCQELGEYINEINHHCGLYTKLAQALIAARHAHALASQGAGQQGARNTPGRLSGPAPGHNHTVSQPDNPASSQIANSAASQRNPDISSAVSQGSPAVLSGLVPPPPGQPARSPPLSASQLAQWCPETLRVGQQLALDMEKAGIHLGEPQRNRMQREPRHVGSVRISGKGSITLDGPTVAGIMLHERDSDIRQQVWRAASRTPLSNVSLLEAMCAARHEQAALVGEPSYARYKAAGHSLAEQPAAIVAFLQELGALVKPKADQEVKVLQKLKADLQGGSQAVEVMPWDVEHLLARARQRTDTSTDKNLDDYLHLPSVLLGLGELSQAVLGVALSVQPARQSETWAHGVLRCDATHDELGFLGTVYLDLCSRPDKYPSAVTFPIRCGRQLPDGLYQTPVMALLASFGPFNCSPRDVRLSSGELRTLLHEWGHCLHSLISRTKYQHLWGTRCAQDLVELPSNLWEHWADDPRGLALLARHHSTREPLPLKGMRALAARRSSFAGLELQQQVLLALADQRLFGQELVQPGSTGQAWCEATEPYASIPFVPGSHPEARMGHLTVYGATYYSYIYARYLSAAVWTQVLQDGPLSRSAGKVLVDKLLCLGGAVPPVAMVKGLLGQSALIQHNASGGWAPSLQAANVQAF